MEIQSCISIFETKEMKHTVLQIFLPFTFLLLSASCFSQKLKNHDDSLKYDVKMMQFEKMFVQANLEKNRKNYEQASALYYDCLKLKPASAAVYYELANVSFFRNKFSEAEEQIKKAIKLDSENSEYKRFLDELYVKMGKKR